MSKFSSFEPDYTHIVNAARNIQPARMPLYEHIIDAGVMEQITRRRFAQLQQGGIADKKEFYWHYADFYLKMGYDTVSFECCIPGPGALQYPAKGVIATRADFDRYPWHEIGRDYWTQYEDDFTALAEAMPTGMIEAAREARGE